MKQAKIFSILVLAATLGYGAIGFYFLPWANFQGDLTRMAMLPETFFGWTRPQPAIAPELLRQATWQQADVLVIGDSFSEPRIWQSVLTRRGLQVRTESWNTLQNVCADFHPWLRKMGFTGRYVVFENIERSLTATLAGSLACQQMRLRVSPDAQAQVVPPQTSFDPDQAGYGGRFSVGIRTWLNALRYNRGWPAESRQVWALGNDVELVHLEQGCRWFSHQRCQDVLFLAQDSAEDLGNDALQAMQRINTRLSGVTPLWLVVPNKSTAYRYPDKKFWDRAEQQLGAPNVLRAVRQALQQPTVDLYPANNTHFSTTGYLLLGEALDRTLQQPAR